MLNQVKLIKSKSADEFETQINDWLSANLNTANSSLVDIKYFYGDGFRGQCFTAMIIYLAGESNSSFGKRL
jgi:hypothetical protein